MEEPVRRLYRSQSDRMLFGICGGLGEYLRIDPTIVRLLLVALVLLTGPAVVVAYLAFALVVPEAPSEQGA